MSKNEKKIKFSVEILISKVLKEQYRPRDMLRDLARHSRVRGFPREASPQEYNYFLASFHARNL